MWPKCILDVIYMIKSLRRNSIISMSHEMIVDFWFYRIMNTLNFNKAVLFILYSQIKLEYHKRNYGRLRLHFTLLEV